MAHSADDGDKPVLEEKLRIAQQIAFASGLFQGDVTVHTLLESLAEGVVIIDETGTILLINRRTEEMFGYDRQALVGQSHSLLVPERFRHVHEGHVKHFFAEPGIRPMGHLLDLAGRRRDGSEFPVEISLSFLETINGVFALAFISDITLRKEYESHLRESEELSHALVEGAKDYAIFMLDGQGNVQSWNKGAEQLKGYPAEEIIGKHFSCFYAEEERGSGRPGEVLNKAAAEGHAEDEVRLVRWDGSRFWANVNISALHDEEGKLRGFSNVTRDITERKGAEDALRGAERRLRDIVEHSTNLFYIHTPDHILVYMSPQTRQFFDCEPEEALVRWTEFITDNPANQTAIEATQRAIDTGRRQPPYQVECIGRKERRIWVEVNETPVVENGKTVAVVGSLTDITERKRAEDALRFSEARFRALFRDNPTMIVTLDTDWTILSANPYCADQLGYEIDELEGRSVLELFREDDRLAVIQQLEKCVQNPGNAYRWQFRKVHKDGTPLWVEETAQAVYGLNGEVNVLVVCQDVTERKRAEEAREKQLVQLEAILNSINEGVAVSDLEGNVVAMNSSALALHGFESTEEVQKHLHHYEEIFELLDLDGKPVPLEQWPLSRVLRGERFTDFEARVRRTDTGKTWISSYSGTPVQTSAGATILCVITMHDISERKQAEEALRKSEIKLAKIFHSVPAIIGISTLAEGRCIEINAPGLRKLGYRREEIVGRSVVELGVWENPADRERVVSALEKEGMVRDLEINFRRRDGRTFTGLFAAELIDFDGERLMLSIVKDITDRKGMEREIARLNADLAARAADLEDINREQKAFNYTVAHDLRKPLTAISGFCQVLRELCGSRLDEQCLGYLQEVYDGTLRMNRLIDALLDFSHLAHVQPRREQVDLTAMAQEAAAELQLNDPGRRIRFRIAEKMRVEGDASLLRAVLDNLLGNAWKYTGGREEAVIEVGLENTGGEAVIFVRDNGTGFDMAYADKLFLPFHRLPGAENSEGFGIGLATVERIVKRHGGRVWAESEPDKGATFYFTLREEETG